MNIDQRTYMMGKGLIALGLWATVAGLWAIGSNLGDGLSGESWAITRIVLGIIGVAGAVLLFSGINSGKTGWQVIVLWAVLQLPYFATMPGHNVTKQLFDGLLGVSNQTTINGEIADFSAIGINVVGIVVLICAMSLRGRLDLWRRRAEPATAV